MNGRLPVVTLLVLLISPAALAALGSEPVPVDCRDPLVGARHGCEEWVFHYNGPAGGEEEGRLVAATPDGATTLVAAWSVGVVDGTIDVLLLAYETDTGDTQWVSGYTAPRPGDDMPVDLAISPDGSTAYVAATTASTDGSDGRDVTVLAFDVATGALRWDANLDGDTYSTHPEAFLAVPPNGDRVLVTVPDHSARVEGQVGVHALDAITGAPIWSASLGLPGVDERPRGAALAGDHLVVAMQRYMPLDGYVAVAAAVDATTGASAWETRIPVDGPAFAQDVVASPDGAAAYVAGNVDARTFVAAVDAGTGEVRWTRHHDSEAGERERVHEMVTSEDGDRVVLAMSALRPRSDWLDNLTYSVLAFDADTGALAWEVVEQAGPLGRDDPRVADLVVSGDRVVLAGWKSPYFVTSTGHSIYLQWTNHLAVAYDIAEGAEVWRFLYNGPENYNDVIHGAAVTPSGDVLLTGFTSTNSVNSENRNVSTIRLAGGDGVPVWIEEHNGPGSAGDDIPTDVIVHPDGDLVLMAGESARPDSRSDAALVAVNATTGDLAWESRIDPGGRGTLWPRSMAMDDAGDRVFLVSSVSAAEWNDRNLGLAAFDARTGAVRWTADYNLGTYESPRDTAVTGDGRVVVGVGRTYDADWNGSGFVFGADAATGDLLWTRLVDAGGTRYDRVFRVVAVGEDQVAVVARGNGDRVLHLDARTGDVTWSYVAESGRVNDLHADDAGRLFALGSANGDGTGEDALALAFDAATGSVLWRTLVDGPRTLQNALDVTARDYFRTAAMDAAGTTLFAAGGSDGRLVAALDPASGDVKWVIRHAMHSTDYARDLAVTPSGDRLVALGGGCCVFGFATSAYRGTDGALLWEAEYQPDDRQHTAYKLAMAPDGSRVFASGLSWGGPHTGPDMGLLAYDVAGDPLAALPPS